MEFIHKRTGKILELLKKRDNLSTYLIVNEPTKIFYNRTIKNTVICNNNLVNEYKKGDKE